VSARHGKQERFLKDRGNIMPFTIICQDITQIKADAIVNAANTKLQMGGGVCGAIFRAAGAAELQAACDKLAPVCEGKAVITKGFRLKAKYVIHTAGPVYSSARAAYCEKTLRSAYQESLKLAVKNGCRSVAFPLISSGIYGYPKNEALRVATSAVTEFLMEHELNVYLAVLARDEFVVSRELMGDVKSYVDGHYVKKHLISQRKHNNLQQVELKDVVLDAEAAEEKNENTDSCFICACSLPLPQRSPNVERDNENSAVPPWLQKTKIGSEVTSSIDERLNKMVAPFSDAILQLIDAKGKTDVEVYKKANIDRKHFSKIRAGKGYTPKKPTILALAIALELSLDETNELLTRAGYALSNASKFDVIVEYFIVNRKYDIWKINEILFKYHQPQLGAR